MYINQQLAQFFIVIPFLSSLDLSGNKFHEIQKYSAILNSYTVLQNRVAYSQFMCLMMMVDRWSSCSLRRVIINH
jgi:hypothetical protein